MVESAMPRITDSDQIKMVVLRVKTSERTKIKQIGPYLSLISLSKVKQGPSGTKHGLEVNLENKNQVRPGIIPSP